MARVLTAVVFLSLVAVASAARIGEPITLHGGGGEKARVKVLEVEAPAKVGEFDRPSKGHRFVAIDMRVKNVGRRTLDEHMLNDSMLIYSGRRQASAEIVSGGPCEDFGSVRISPGDFRRGCVVFEIPKGKFPKVFQFTLNSGFADETGEWRL